MIIGSGLLSIKQTKVSQFKIVCDTVMTELKVKLREKDRIRYGIYTEYTVVVVLVVVIMFCII